MNTTYLMEPCCIERQAPHTLTEAKGRALMWTNGDVNVQHWFKALSYMAGPCHQLTLLVQQPDVQLMRWVKNWMQRGWTTRLQLTTHADCRQLVQAELDGLLDRVSLAVDSTLQSEFVVFEGDRGVVVICGPILTTTQPGITVYACYYAKERGMVGELMAAIESRHKAHALSMADVRGQKEEVEDGVVAEATQTKTKTKTKKAKKSGVVADAPQN